jgi:hypothetical protein
MLRKFRFLFKLYQETNSFYIHLQRILAVESQATHDDTKWLVYWVVYTLLGFIEYIRYAFFHNLLFYWLGKCLFLIWLMRPGQNGGSHVVYDRLIRPLVSTHHPTVEKNTRDGNINLSVFI